MKKGQDFYDIQYIYLYDTQVLTRSIEGLGQHGMVGTSDQSLINLHDALRIEFQKVEFSLEKVEFEF